MFRRNVQLHRAVRLRRQGSSLAENIFQGDTPALLAAEKIYKRIAKTMSREIRKFQVSC